MQRYLLAFVIAFFVVLSLVLSDGHAGNDKGSAWKPYLPADAYAELTKRSIVAIETIAKSGAKDAREKIEVEAAILTGYTLSVKDSDEAAKLRGAAQQAAQWARNGDLKKLAGFGATIATAPKAAVEKAAIKKTVLQELQWLMETFKGKAKGGEGLHVDLYYHPKLKNLNGTEAFIGAIAGKKLSDENVAKVAKELPNLAYRVAVIGSITHEFAPEKEAGKWRDLSNQMRDASIALAEAATKKNADGIFKSAQSLESTCTQCHMVFKKN